MTIHKNQNSIEISNWYQDRSDTGLVIENIKDESQEKTHVSLPVLVLLNNF